MANFQISHSVQIDRSAETVFQYISDISQVALWRPNISVRDYSGDPFGVGTTWSEASTFMGRDMIVAHEVTELDPGRHFTMKQEASVVSGHVTWNLSPDSEDSCTATLSFDGETSGWIANLASGLLRNQAQKSMTRDLANLKANLESS
jgi:uncharacterized protein YndB with AHSA1/START domain